MAEHIIDKFEYDSEVYKFQDNVSGYAPLASPALTGIPTAPTATSGDSSTQIATTAFVQNAMSGAGAGTVTSVGVSNDTNGGLSVSGSPITSSGTITIGHSNVLSSAQTTSAVYPIKIDKNGHISEYGSATTIPTITLNGNSTTTPSFYAPTGAGTNGQYLKSNGSGAPSWTNFPTIVNTRETPTSGGTTLSVVNTGDMYTWNNKLDAFKITLSYSNNTYSVDKTVSEIEAAISSGKYVYLYDATESLSNVDQEIIIGTLVSAQPQNAGTIQFSAIIYSGDENYYLVSYQLAEDEDYTANAFCELLDFISWNDKLDAFKVTLFYDSQNDEYTVNRTEVQIEDAAEAGKYVYLYDATGQNTIIAPLTTYDSQHGYIFSTTTGYDLTYYVLDQAGVSVGTAIHQTIAVNGSVSSSVSLYAPTTAGTNGYVLKSNGSGAPTWSSETPGAQIVIWTES